MPIRASEHGCTGTLKTLVSLKADLDQETMKGTALMVAVSCGRKSAVMELIKQRATVDLETQTGCTAVTVACATHRVEILNLLISMRANPGRVSQHPQGKSPLKIVNSMQDCPAKKMLMTALRL